MTVDTIMAKLTELDDQRERHLSAVWLLGREIDILRQQLRGVGFMPPALPSAAA